MWILKIKKPKVAILKGSKDSRFKCIMSSFFRTFQIDYVIRNHHWKNNIINDDSSFMICGASHSHGWSYRRFAFGSVRYGPKFLRTDRITDRTKYYCYKISYNRTNSYRTVIWFGTIIHAHGIELKHTGDVWLHCATDILWTHITVRREIFLWITVWLSHT